MGRAGHAELEQACVQLMHRCRPVRLVTLVRLIPALRNLIPLVGTCHSQAPLSHHRRLSHHKVVDIICFCDSFLFGAKTTSPSSPTSPLDITAENELLIIGGAHPVWKPPETALRLSNPGVRTRGISDMRTTVRADPLLLW
jgi:hypothetical protein